jgi:polar amino acid transport system substrate-binding protein
MKLLALFFFLLLPIASADPARETAAAHLATLHQETGGYKNTPQDPIPTLAATNMALRAYRYLRIDLADTTAHQKFLLSRFDPKQAAFIENGEPSPSVLANAFALMLMAELRLAEDIHAISAKVYLVEHASTPDEIYLAMAGLAVMDLDDEIPASWIKKAMDTAVSEDPAITPYDKARSIITCMRTGFNLPDYTRFATPLTTAFTNITTATDWHQDSTALQQAYTLARALVMIDARAPLTLPTLTETLEKNPPVAALYRHAALQTWQPKLRGRLTVAICTGFAPVGYRDATGQIAGMDPDLIRAFAKEHGYELIIEEQTIFNGIWDLPAKGHIDLALSGLSKRRDRLSPGIRWSYPYFNVDRSLSILKSNADRFRTIADFDGMKIAVTAGTTGDQDIRERNPNAIRVPYDNEDLAIRDLLAGRVHALARGDVSNRYDARLHSELTVIDTHPMNPPEEFVIALAKDRVALGQKLDRFLRDARKTATLDQLFAPYLQN